MQNHYPNKNLLALCALISLAVGIGFAQQLPSSPQDEGVVTYWSFDEGEGDIVFDQTANENHGTVHNVSWVSGKLGLALKFTGDSHVTIPFAPSLEPENLSISFWIYPIPTEEVPYAVIRKDE